MHFRKFSFQASCEELIWPSDSPLLCEAQPTTLLEEVSKYILTISQVFLTLQKNVSLIAKDTAVLQKPSKYIINTLCIKKKVKMTPILKSLLIFQPQTHILQSITKLSSYIKVPARRINCNFIQQKWKQDSSWWGKGFPSLSRSGSASFGDNSTSWWSVFTVPLVARNSSPCLSEGAGCHPWTSWHSYHPFSFSSRVARSISELLTCSGKVQLPGNCLWIWVTFSFSFQEKKKKNPTSKRPLLLREKEMILSCFYEVQFSPLPREHCSLRAIGHYVVWGIHSPFCWLFSTFYK